MDDNSKNKKHATTEAPASAEASAGKQKKDKTQKFSDSEKLSDSVDARVVHLKEKVEELENQTKRIFADYQNLEKRTAIERREMIISANKELIIKILPALDNLERALKAGAERGEKGLLLDGVKITVQQLRDILKQEGLGAINVNPLDQFDPQMHEVVGTREGPEEKIVDVLQMGYNLNGKLFRPARVIVGKGDAEINSA